MNQSIDTIFVGGLIRMIQGFAQAAPTLIVGLFIAAILRYYVGQAGTQRLFGGEGLRSLFQSWLVGMLLPVCSIGVLPILFEMRRAKIKPGAMSAFALSAPLFNPLSLLYGLTLSRPLVIILFALASLLVVTLLGLFWDRLAEKSASTSSSNLENDQADELNQLVGLRRIAATFVYFCREATGTTLLATVVALGGLALLAAVLPFGAMQSSVERDDWWAPLKMLLIALPVYATPMLAMSQLGMMFQHANSPGASFALLILGAGMNLATPLWFARNYGWKAATSWLLALLFVVLSLAYAINQPLVPPGVEPAGHTHAFDIYANPISESRTINLAVVRETLSKDFGLAVIIPLAILGVVACLGFVFRGLKIDEAVLLEKSKRAAANRSESERSAGRGLEMEVPRSVIGVTMLAGLVGLSVVACYAYYPSPAECLEEISLARSECLSGATSGNIEHALFYLPIWEDWSRRLEVGTFLRKGELRPYQRMQGYLIRKKIELLEHELEHDPFEPEEVKKVLDEIFSTNSRWVSSFREPNDQQH